VKAKEIRHSEILHLEAEMNSLWSELNTSNIPHVIRLELEQQLKSCEEKFKAVLGGEVPLADLKKSLADCDRELAIASVTQAKGEIPKSEHTSGPFLALENVHRDLEEGRLSPAQARHELKNVVRHRLG
jgi:hypothetical protein